MSEYILSDIMYRKLIWFYSFLSICSLYRLLLLFKATGKKHTSCFSLSENRKDPCCGWLTCWEWSTQVKAAAISTFAAVCTRCVMSLRKISHWPHGFNKFTCAVTSEYKSSVSQKWNRIAWKWLLWLYRPLIAGNGRFSTGNLRKGIQVRVATIRVGVLSRLLPCKSLAE